MSRRSLFIGSSVVIVVLALILIDLRIRTQAARTQQSHEQTTNLYNSRIKGYLVNVRTDSSGNAIALKEAIALESAYAQTEQTSAGVRGFKATLTRSTPRLMAPLIGQARVGAKVHLSELDMYVNWHTDALASNENSAEANKGGLLGKVQRSLGLSDSP